GRELELGYFLFGQFELGLRVRQPREATGRDLAERRGEVADGLPPPGGDVGFVHAGPQLDQPGDRGVVEQVVADVAADRPRRDDDAGDAEAQADGPRRGLLGRRRRGDVLAGRSGRRGGRDDV